ncbi:ankyrin repeat domain-containing protein [Leptospira kanakyensis]|uniref:ankyrin repeat domain-containing protein n=1 Tax=Leptospira kanakyensis TaxID=2484968 RepID=UPI00223E78AD|nr:ankyrin repeat domain-containing protein [Leptospira kanakyensis]MCW7470972.1 ankyrin repeat domain-containing protein [Leptospira kanakyensis]
MKLRFSLSLVFVLFVIFFVNCFAYHIKNGNVGPVASALDKGQDINEKNEEGNTPLMLASRYKQHEMMKLLLSRGAKINETNLKGETALTLSTSRLDLVGVKILLEHGANPNIIKSNGDSALHSATISGNEEIAFLLIKHGADVRGTQQSQANLLYWASHSCSLKLVTYYLGKNINPEWKYLYGATPIMTVCATYKDAKEAVNPEKIVKILIEHKANVNARSDAGTTPLHAAASDPNFFHAKALIENGAEVNALDNLGETPLMKSVGSGFTYYVEVRVIKLLLSNGADKTVKDNLGKTAYDHAVKNRLPKEYLDLVR